MSLATDLKFGKWLLKKGVVSKGDIEKHLSSIKKMESQGKKTPNLLSLLFKEGVIDKAQAQALQKEWKERTQQKKDALGKEEPSKEEAPRQSEQEQEGAELEASGEEASGEAKPAEAKSTKDESAETKSAEGEMITCVECQSSNPSTGKDCSTCGALLPRKDLIDCVVCQKTQKKSRSHCVNCGCDPQSGDAGPASRQCQSCETVLLPGQVICLSCGMLNEGDKKKTWALGGMGLVAIQILALGASLFSLSSPLGSASSSASDPLQEEVVYRDPYENVPPRSIGEAFGHSELSEDSKLFLKELDHDSAHWGSLESKLLEREDALGIHGALMLGLSFYEQDRGLELVALSKAHPQMKGLRALALGYRMQQARRQFDAFDVKQALAQARPLMADPNGSSYISFWTGVFAFADQELDFAKNCFLQAVRGDSPIAQGHLFLYLLNKKSDLENAKGHLEKLYEGVVDQEAAKKLVSPYLEGS